MLKPRGRSPLSLVFDERELVIFLNNPCFSQTAGWSLLENCADYNLQMKHQFFQTISGKNSQFGKNNFGLGANVVKLELIL